MSLWLARQRAAVRRASRAFLAILCVAVMPSAHAAGEWLDEMPSVERAVEVIAVGFNRSPENDDYTAINLTGTFVLLRRVLEYRAALDGPPSAALLQKSRALYYSYLQAELAIGRGIGKRSTIRQDCINSRSADCSWRWFKTDVMNTYPVVNFQERVLPLLFTEARAAEYVEMIHDRVVRSLRMHMPTETLDVPPVAATGFPAEMKVADECLPYGGDADGDGLCDCWEALFQSAKEPRKPVAWGCGDELTLTKVTTIDARSIEVEYDVNEQFLAQDVRFIVYRANQSELTGTEQPIGEESVSIPAGRASVERKITILRNTDLPPDANQPYVVVVATYGQRDSTKWFRKRLLGAVAHGYTFRYLHGFTQSGERWLGGFIESLDAALALARLEEIAAEIPLYWVRDNTQVPREWLRDNKDIASLVVQDLRLNNPDVEKWQEEIVHKLKTNACYDEATFPFNWRYESVTNLRTILHAKGADLYEEVRTRARALAAEHEGDVVDVHLIGHSRGAVIVSQALLAWEREPDPALHGSWVRVTLLDPHPANNRFSPNEDVLPDSGFGRLSRAQYEKFQDDASDPTVELPGGVGVRDVLDWYQQETVTSIQAVVPDEDDNGIGDFELRISPMNLWGLAGNSKHIVNNSGVAIRSLRLRELPDNRGTMAHNGVPAAYSAALGRSRSGDERASPARGDCSVAPH